MRKQIKRGFTLVELLVVITIISVLTIITVSQFQTARRRANDVSRKGDINSLSKALQLYYTDIGVFPDSITWGGELTDSSGYSYMKVVPREKNSSLPDFCYITSADYKKFAILAMMENTADSDCRLNGGSPFYTIAACGGESYCYAVVSPNTSLNADGSFN